MSHYPRVQFLISADAPAGASALIRNWTLG